MTNILIATDYSLESLNILKKILAEKQAENNTKKYNIIFVSGYEQGDSIRDLLFSSKTNVIKKISSPEFNDACSIITNKYAHLINKITCDIFTGNFQHVFNNYIKVKNIEEAYFSSSLKYDNRHQKFSIHSFLKKCKNLKIREIYFETSSVIPEKGKLAEVFI